MPLQPGADSGLEDTGFPARWIEGHNLAAAALGKPLLLEEFGNIATGDAANLTRVRDPLYRTVYQAVAASLAAGRPLRGASFWEWAQEGSGRAQRAVETTDTAWQIIAQNAALANASSGTPVAGCVAVGAAAASSPAAPPLTLPLAASPPPAKAAPPKAAPPMRLPVVLPAPPNGASPTVLPNASGLLAQPFATPPRKVPAATPPPPGTTLADSGAGSVLTAGGFATAG